VNARLYRRQGHGHRLLIKLTHEARLVIVERVLTRAAVSCARGLRECGGRGADDERARRHRLDCSEQVSFLHGSLPAKRLLTVACPYHLPVAVGAFEAALAA